jgi:hypothetical protein
VILRAKNGDEIEIERSANGNPPGTPAWRQHTNVSTVWARVQSGEWKISPYRNQHRTIAAAIESASAAEFFAGGPDNADRTD